MTSLRTLFSRISFRQQLFIIVSLGVVGLSLIASLSTAWMTSKQISALLVKQGLQITGNLARQSVLALLYQSGENAQRAVDTTRAFPGIGHVMVVDREGVVLLQQGENRLIPPAPPSWPKPEDAPHLVAEGDGAWQFAAPVYLREAGASDELPFAQGAAKPELLGHVYVLMDKTALQEVRQGIISQNLNTALLITLLVLATLHISLKRMLRPLNQLADVMLHAETIGPGRLASAHGPPEVVHIAQTYNRMMMAIAERDKKLRGHNILLEQEVAERTRELVEARDAALELSRHKSEFLANMSHELRTPLQAIIGFADVVREVLEDEGLEDAAQDVVSIQVNAQHLLIQINEVLDFARVEAGRMVLHLEPVDLNTLVRQVEKTVQPAMQDNGNTLETRIWTTEGENPLLDDRKVRQILLNLLSNAAKFTQGGKVVLEVRQEPHQLTLRVTDTGIGIAPEHLEAIFDPFRQVDGSLTRHYQGSGLGLAITRRFCHLMGGELTVQSGIGQGTGFRITIPLPVTAGQG